MSATDIAVFVSFCSKPIVVHDHLCRNDYSREEQKQSWYNKKELHAIQRETQKTITWIMGGKRGGETIFCSRGLESKTPAKSRIHKLRRQEAVRTVLKVQETSSANAQGKKGCNPELIAKAYASFSTHSMEEAKIMASYE